MRKKSATCTAIGCLLLAAALGITIYNILDNRRAGMAVKATAERLEEIIPRNAPDDAEQTMPVDEEDIPDYVLNPEMDMPVAEEDIPDYVLNPEMDMPVIQVDGCDYIGTLELPTLGLTLPVMSDWDYPRLKIAPCRYAGSAYQGDLVIAAHNYTNHFGTLKNLKIGDRITFTDLDGNIFSYSVAEIQTLDPYAVEDMQSGDWALTLFTCTVGGQSRVTVRCELSH